MAKIADIAKTLLNLGKGIGLEKERTGHNEEFNLDKFKGALQRDNSLMRANRYVVTITPGPGWSWISDQAEQLVFFCDAVNIPGVTINPSDITRLGLGTFDRRPGRMLPSEISASFMLDQSGRNLNFFQTWVTNIVNMDGRNPNGERSNGALYGEQYYRNNYIGTMEIATYDVAANKVLTLTAHEVWPNVLGDVTMGWAQNDEFARVQVNFQLRYWTTDLQEIPASSERALGGFERLIRLGTAGQSLISSMKTPNNVGDAINIVSNAQSFLGTLGGRG